MLEYKLKSARVAMVACRLLKIADFKGKDGKVTKTKVAICFQ